MSLHKLVRNLTTFSTDDILNSVENTSSCFIKLLLEKIYKYNVLLVISYANFSFDIK